MGRKPPYKSSENDSSTSTPTWNTSPNSLLEYYYELTEWPQSRDTDFSTLVHYGYVVDGRYVCCTSQNHIDRVVMGNITKGSFRSPCIIARNDYRLHCIRAHGSYALQQAEGGRHGRPAVGTICCQP
jgi:hypothetical protein